MKRDGAEPRVDIMQGGVLIGCKAFTPPPPTSPHSLERTANDMAQTNQNIEVDEKEVPQQIDYAQDGGNVKMAAPVDQAERRLLRKVSI